MRLLRIALAQLNMTVGDIEANVGRIVRAIGEAESLGADIVAVPELAVTGYPPEDLLLKPEFIAANLRALEQIATATKHTVAVVGFADRKDDLYNAAAVLHAGRVAAVYHKNYLPNYAVFDEDRYFRAGTERPVFEIAGGLVGVSICEDIWYPDGPPIVQALQGGAELLINISSSPYFLGRAGARERMLATRAADTTAFVAYVNMVGGQDELVFDGQSMIFAPHGGLIARGRAFAEELVVVDLDLEEAFRARLHDPRRRKVEPVPTTVISLTREPIAGKSGLGPPAVAPALAPEEEVYRALVLGTGDYVRKNGFHKVVIGLSGGIDSSLVAAIAAEALGPGNVVGISMPSRYSSEGSRSDAETLARNLGIEYRTIAIEGPFKAYEELLREEVAGGAPITWENLQARIRGVIIMALSNAHGWLVLTTGNKSEVSTGYATLYGDMAGGFAVIKDVPKTMVYRLAEYANRAAGREIIPRVVIEKEPSAELKPDQRDTDSLPPYEMLDPILHAYVEEDMPIADIVGLGNAPELVTRVVRMVDLNEYKRRQAPPGVRVTSRAFGRDRRLPITNRFRGGPLVPQPERQRE
jgi:NAD+ synthase (glutamine-hydrolysing)